MIALLRTFMKSHYNGLQGKDAWFTTKAQRNIKIS
jgi:hypothetical protein